MLDLNFTPFPVLITPQLKLRQLNASDAQEIFIHRSNERILEFIDIPKAKSIEDALAFINKRNKCIAENESIFWGIQFKDQPMLIGTICLWNISKETGKGEIGYVLHPDFQGRGIMQEAVKRVIEYVFGELKLKSIEADVHPENIKSIQLLKRNGFIFEKDSSNLAVFILKRTAGN